MKKFLICILVIYSTTLISCFEEDCDSNICDSGKFYKDVHVDVTINSENQSVMVELFRGRVEEGELIGMLNTTVSTAVFNDIVANRYYSVKVYYIKGNKNIVAINGKLVSPDTDDCDCSIDGGFSTINATLAK